MQYTYVPQLAGPRYIPTHMYAHHTHFLPQQHGIRWTKRYGLCSSHSSDSSRTEALPSFPPECSAFIFPLYIIQVQIINSGYQIKM